MSVTYHDHGFSEILIAEGVISQDRLARLLGERENATESVGDMLVRVGFLSEQERVRYTGKQLGMPYVALSDLEIDGPVARLVTSTMAIRLSAIPIERSATSITVAFANPLDIHASDEIRAHTGLDIDPVISSREDIQGAITRVFGTYDELGALVTEATETMPGVESEELSASSLNELSQGDSRSPVIRLVNEILMRGIASRTSDIHLNPEKDRVRVRYRVDGMLTEVITIPKNLQLSVISRLKIMGNMDIAERRAPQDGRISLTTQMGEYDFRVSTYPSVHGENMVLRILDKKAARIGLEKLGMPFAIHTQMDELIHRPYGMVLVCGPTGSGKTTTLYACLNAINEVHRNIMTIEDPVEYQLQGIIQGNVNPKAGVTFASGLRTLVRQDPDIILVGEIRDSETARIAIEAALTGHLVMSTIHANDSAGAITRLIDMGVEPFLVASALMASLSQRLIRVNCVRCGQPHVTPSELLTTLDLPPDAPFTYQKGTGCEMCNQTGYRGRRGIYELLSVDEKIQQMILTKAPTQELKAAGLCGRGSLRDDAITKLREGLSTPEEVLRITMV
ncbi:MAG: Flp pilus assembly complex ATPase component TadA [Chthonomonadaceae bacterium]|nr:Flp pilus assembly complex ATPase component TadA [Chthonomonadaceae bacterium]